MTTKYFNVLISLLLMAVASLAAQNAPLLSSTPAATRRVTAAPVGTVVVHRGQSAAVEIPFRVARGYHINSNRPTSELLVPTVLSLSPPTNILVGDTSYPPGQDKSFSFAPNEKLNVYTGDFSVTTLVKPARNIPYGTYRVHGALKYQACDDRACYPPGKVPIAFDVKVAKPRRVRHNPAQSPHIHK
jgi:Thiol:disulfide interchange protein DsbD, N-terminal